MTELTAMVELLKEDQCFFSFDIFLINKMEVCSTKIRICSEITEEIRLEAYHECMKRIGVNRVAAMQTIQRWFGIHGKSVPDRETVIKLIFSLHLSREEAEEYLIYGIGEPGFQINDYRELIFLYSLEKGYSYEEALCLIDEFEERFPDEKEIILHNETNKLWIIFEDKKDLEKEAFLEWMLGNSSYFKGYGLTALNYLEAFKQEILAEVKEDAERRLEELLRETRFSWWKEKKGYSSGERKVVVLKFLEEAERDTGERVSDSIENNIRELIKISEISTDSNMELLLELYASAVENKGLRSEKRRAAGAIDWTLLDNKYLSEILNIGHQKEKQLRLCLLKKRLEMKAGFRKCSKEIMKLAQMCGFSEKKRVTVGELQNWVEQSLIRTDRRIRLVQRQDLLPLILTVVQFRYLYQLEKTGETYQQEEGKRLFKELSDTTLNACNMEPLNTDKYKLDALLWNCFQEEEMYSVSDVLEIL